MRTVVANRDFPWSNDYQGRIHALDVSVPEDTDTDALKQWLLESFNTGLIVYATLKHYTSDDGHACVELLCLDAVFAVGWSVSPGYVLVKVYTEVDTHPILYILEANAAYRLTEGGITAKISLSSGIQHVFDSAANQR